MQDCGLVTVEAYDDGFFPVEYKGGRGDTYVVGVKTCGSSRIINIAASRIIVDGGWTHVAVREMSRLLGGGVIMLDGVTYAGFDVVDPFSLSSETGKPVIAVQLHPLNLERVKAALLKHFADWEERFRVIRDYYNSLVPVETPWRPIQVAYTGISLGEAVSILRQTCIYSPEPEPLRIADMIASSLSRLWLNQCVLC
ncbi:DUF99 family protein [Desulfurococcus mucosus]|uniref:UPF0215 protein Desmu_0003 n=1 Tax=Desulfurococcus mucosus (strain ATCC 35584 / DSM 2162 / JCM 9187 / O7/1) TaxID=765177 RepID=E8RA44_DESM0|nr:DUF99 family protein [Desulfurococcus mucosus]ADV64322.1 protein of unknown function DUF99 [Desulfurococcus mucosus DSM 2162]